MQDAAVNNRLLYIDKEKGHRFNSGRLGSKSPTTISQDVLKENIAQFWDNVNWRDLKNKNRGKSSIAYGDMSSSAMADAFKNAKKLKQSRDADYLSAVNRGDMQTAQRMVDEAAERASFSEGSDVASRFGHQS